MNVKIRKVLHIIFIMQENKEEHKIVSVDGGGRPQSGSKKEKKI